ncbi:hypothetical protein [Acinetobacter baumannii]|uniref:hypothetical protein n=1 Tax=Acinetobacter baumannii TaxID=470 RepID=UPI00112796DA|nr:hypothetical protein [Acinetobacter baumannii]TPS23225.1 hypothetical protein FJV09_15725 [Acinetobacter baumannii]
MAFKIAYLGKNLKDTIEGPRLTQAKLWSCTRAKQCFAVSRSSLISREVQKYDLESNSLALGLSVAQFIPSSPIISREVFSDATKTVNTQSVMS